MKFIKPLIFFSILMLIAAFCMSCDNGSQSNNSNNNHTHTFSTWEVITKSTCTTPGTQTRACSSCGFSEYSSIPASGHSEVVDMAVSPTCSANGKTEGKHCALCETVIVKQEVIPKINHTLLLVSKKEPTCVEDGYTAYEYCTECEYSTAFDILPASHSLEIVPEKLPTCTEDGYTAYEHCTKCEYSTAFDILPASHSLEIVPEKLPTCTEDGYTAYEHCTKCEYFTAFDILPASHSLETVPEKLPTCTEDGYTAYEYCTKCNYSTQKNIPAAHTIVYIDEQLPTCYENGHTAYEYCTMCDYTTYQELLAEHSIVSVDYLAPTCYTDGHNAYEHCTMCDYTTYTLIPSSHNLVWKEEKEPTCTEEGYYGHNYCTACEYSEKQIIPRAEHSLLYADSLPPTCMNDGHTAYEYCENCDYTTCVTISAVPHKYDTTWTIDVLATEDKNGVISHHCIYDELSGCAMRADVTEYAYEYYTNGLKFTMMDSGTWEVSMGDAEGGDIIIPRTYLGIPVTRVGRFERNINSITLPEGITEIGYGAFYSTKIECGRLTLPSTVKTIEGMSLYYSGLYSIDFGSSAPCVSYDAIGSALHEVRVDSIESWFVICQNYSILQHLGHLYVNGKLLEGNVVIPDGCTWIPQYAFANQMHVTSVTIPSSVKTIGYRIFTDSAVTDVYYKGSLEEWCSVVMYDASVTGRTLHIGGVKLEGELIIPQSVTDIGDYAFANQDITSLVLHDGIKTIGKEAFSGTLLEKLDIPASVELIKEKAFSGLKLQSLALPYGKVNLGSSVFSSLIIDTLIIPEGCTGLEDSMFAYSVIDTLVLPVSLKYANNAFSNSEINKLYYNCEELSTPLSEQSLVGTVKEIYIGAQVKHIPDMAFAGSRAENVYFAESSVLLSIGSRAFDTMYAKHLMIPETVLEIAEDAFGNCAYVEYAYCPSGVTLTLASSPDAIIGNELVVSEDSFLFLVSNGKYYLIDARKTLSGEVVLPLHPTGEYEYIVMDIPYSPDLTSLTIPKTATVTKNIFDDLPNLEVLISEGKLEYCYLSGHGIKRLELLGEVAFVPNFSYDSALEYLVLGEYITEIPNGAFAQCTALTYVELSNSLIRMGDECFRNCISLRYLLIPDSVTYLLSPASEWTYVGLVHSSPEGGYFSGYHHINVKEYGYNGEEMWYIDNSGVKHTVEIIELPDKYDDGTDYYPGDTTEEKVIGKYLYDGIHSYDIVDGVYIYRAYLGDTSNGVVVLPESIDGHRYVLGDYAFSGCDWLISITIRGVDVIEDSAIDNCVNLTNVILHEGLMEMGSAFSGCTSLKTVTIPKSVCFINAFAFYGCDELESVVFLNVDDWFVNDIWYPCYWQRCPKCIATAFREYYVAYGARNLHTSAWYDYIQEQG